MSRQNGCWETDKFHILKTVFNSFSGSLMITKEKKREWKSVTCNRAGVIHRDASHGLKKTFRDTDSHSDLPSDEQHE